MSDGGSTREELLDAAYEVLVDPEYEGFTTAAVADAAGRNQSLVHYHFDTKAELIRALFDYLHEIVDEPIDAAAAIDDPVERLTALLSFLLWIDEDAFHAPAGREEAIAFKRGFLWLESQAPYDEELREAMAENRDGIWDAVRATIEDGIESGRFRDDVDSELVTALLNAAVGGAMTWGAIYGEDSREELVVDAIETLIEEWLVA
jgi:AcrR family transcriptional regulator